MRKYNGKQRKESFHARSLARSGFQRQRAAILPPLPHPLFGLDKELPVCLRFAFSRLYSLSTVHHGAANVCMNVCAHVFRTYIRIPFPLYVSLSRAPPSLFLPFCCSVSLSLSLLLSPSLFRFCGDVVVLWAISSRMCIQSLHASGSVSQTLDAGPVS